MLAIVFTTFDEASVLADLHGDVRFDDLEEGSPIRVGDVIVAVTGEGKIKATLATERLLRARDVSPLVHVGACTSLDDAFSPGSAVGISHVLEGDRVELEAPTYPRMPLECPFDVSMDGTLVSQDHMPDDPEERGYWERLADVRDSTGYPVAYVAAQHGTPCHIVKAVTRHVDDAAPAEPPEEALGTMNALLRGLLEEGRVPG